jgi:hypothetical protein
MAVIEVVLEKLRRYPQLRFHRTGRSITIAATGPAGFEVCLVEQDGFTVVSFGGWHEHFESEADANPTASTASSPTTSATV